MEAVYTFVYMVDQTSKPSRRRTAAAVQIEFVILADRAEVVANKLYMMGGAWDRIQVSSFPTIFPMAVAVRIRLPKAALHADHSLELTLRRQGGEPILRMGAQLIQQSPSRSDVPSLATVAIPLLARFNEPGVHVVEVTVSGGETSSTLFTVEQSPVST